MPQNLNFGQQQYCRLVTLLVGDDAIRRGIVTSQNVTPVLHFFIAAGREENISQWLMPKGKSLKESRWLQIVGWLIDRMIIAEYKKSRIAGYLFSRHEFIHHYETQSSIQNAMSKPLPPDIQRELYKILKDHFIIVF